MHVLLSSARHDSLQKAGEWFAAATVRPVMEAVCSWVQTVEPAWGECLVFVETDIPGLGRLKGTNVDLILAFSDRVAVCEVKQHQRLAAARTTLFSSLRQTSSQVELISTHLKLTLPRDSIRPILFLTEMDSVAVAELTESQLMGSSLRRVCIAGGWACQRAPTLPSHHPVYLPTVLSERLGAIPPLNPRLFPGRAHEVLSHLIEPTSLIRFDTYVASAAFLNAMVDPTNTIQYNPHYVTGKRPHELAHLMEHVSAQRVVEVVGQTGSGKSAFIREALVELQKDRSATHRVAVCDLSAYGSAKAVYRDILTQLDREPYEHDDDAAMERRLRQTDGVVWIRSYDAGSEPYVRQLIAAFDGNHDYPCLLIVESPVPLTTNPTDVVRLNPLGIKDLEEILATHKPGRDGRTRYVVASRSNPRIAIAQWKHPDATFDPAVLHGDYQWVDRVFKRRRQFLSFLVSIIDDSPIGLEAENLYRIATAVFSNLPASFTREELRWIIETLESTGDLHVFRVSTDEVGPLAEGFRRAVFTRIGGVSQPLATYVRQTTDPEDLTAWRRRVDETLEILQLEYPGGHLDILMSLRRGELIPCFQASFRHGFDDPDAIIDWLDRHQDIRASATGVDQYLERALRVVARATSGEAYNMLDAARDLGPPPAGDQLAIQVRVAIEMSARVVATGALDIGMIEKISEVYGPQAAVLCLSLLTATQDGTVWRPLWDLRVKVSSCPPATRLLWYHSLLYCMLLRGPRFWRKRQRMSLDVSRRYFQLALDTDDPEHALYAVRFYREVRT